MTRTVGAAVFVAIALIGLAMDLCNRRRTRSAPTFTQALNWLEARPVGQIAVFAIWAFTGWHFFVR